MKKVSPQHLSRYRQTISQLTKELKRLCLRAGHSDLIFRGTPIEVYRKCGKPSCRCAAGGDSRHGPYQAIQVWEDGKQRQISLKQSEREYFQMALHYQHQQVNHKKIVEIQKQILEEVKKMIEARCIWSKE